MVMFLLLMSKTIYYYLFAAKTQTIAQEEQAVMFQLHVAKGNKRKRHHRAGPPTGGGTSFFSKSKILSSVRPASMSRLSTQGVSPSVALSAVKDSTASNEEQNGSQQAGGKSVSKAPDEVRSPQGP